MSVVLKVWGDYACFSRPDAGKVERFSYPIITPSAARAVFDAIYWKPKFRWRIERIEMLAAPRYLSLMRNEVKDRANTDAMEAARKDGMLLVEARQGKEPNTDAARSRLAAAQTRAVPSLLADATPDEVGTDQKGRTQRQTMALQNVAYRLHASPQLFRDNEGDRKGILGQFQRRARAGQCRWQPYLGCREFAAYFELLEGDAATKETPVAYNETIGVMLYDVFDLTRSVPEDFGASVTSFNDSRAFVSAFRAEIKDGVLDVPRFESDHVFKPRGMSMPDTQFQGGTDA